jgi:hypothetical protein
MNIFEPIKTIVTTAIAVYLALIAMAYTLPLFDELLGIMP